MVEATRARLAVDIGGTFTDVVLARGAELHSIKVLTSPAAPERAVLEGIASVLATSAVRPAEIELFVHGTTLATNAIIERKGAVTALLTTEGFRDVVEIAYENRFEQYDLSMVRPAPLVPRELRLGIGGRLSARGDELVALDESAVRAAVPQLRAAGVEAIAVGYLHAYLNPAHEQATAAILAEEMPEASVTLSSDVCPEIREYERFSTVCANAYVQPLMSRYLRSLAASLQELGIVCPFFLLQSSGGLMSLERAMAQPVMLVESGPAGGALLAARLAASHRLDRVVSFDMGGTTAKLCLIEGGKPQTGRTFEVARVYRFLKGSGLPLRIPVIDMVEIGAGGGSIAHLDDLGRVRVGPRSAAGEPGPACYGRGGTEPTVTDADVALGRIDPASFAGGSMTLDVDAAGDALRRGLGSAAFGQEAAAIDLAAFAVAEVVDENMANAARVHAIERGRDVRDCTLVAFGGAAPLHACRLADKLGIDRIIIPDGAGVGSAIGFLRAPVSYEAVRTRHQRLRAFDGAAIDTLLAAMADEARSVIEQAAPSAPVTLSGSVSMRYVGQGHEVTVPLNVGEPLEEATLLAAFEATYRTHFTRTIPHLEIEALSWTLVAATAEDAPPSATVPPASPEGEAVTDGGRDAWDAASGRRVRHATIRRDALSVGQWVRGPALIIEDQTTTVVASAFVAFLDDAANLVLQRRA